MNRIPICAGAVAFAAALAGAASAAPGQHSHELPVERGAWQSVARSEEHTSELQSRT